MKLPDQSAIKFISGAVNSEEEYQVVFTVSSYDTVTANSNEELQNTYWKGNTAELVAPIKSVDILGYNA